MRQLRFVALAEDGEHALLETTDGDERFALPVDGPLREALHTDLPRLIAPPVVHVEPEPEPTPLRVAPAVTDSMSPREIQVRVRSGESPEELATAAGMSLERVMRFAGPVIDERKRIADEARRARARRSGEGDARVVVFGEAVDQRFAAHGVDAESVEWDAHRRDDGEWLVMARWKGGDATYGAEWLFSRSARSVTAIDDTATDLLSDRPIRPVAPPQPTRPTLVAAPALAPGVVAFPPMADAHTSPLPTFEPVDEDVFDQEAVPDVPTRESAEAQPTLAFDEPPLPLGIEGSPARHLRNLGVTRRDESDDEKAARARVPSWDDILLGIRRKD